MKIVWLTNAQMPAFVRRCGAVADNKCGWLPSLLSHVMQLQPGNEIVVLSEGRRDIDFVENGVRYIGVGRVRRHSWTCSPSTACCKYVQELLSLLNPDVIHLHGTEGVWASFPKEVFGRVPVASSLQGILSGYYPHYVGNLLPREVKSWKNLPNVLLTRYTVFRGGESWRFKLSQSEMKAFRGITHFLGRTDWDRAWTHYLAPQAVYSTVGELLREPFYKGGRTDATKVSHQIYCGAAFAYPLKGGHWLIRAIASLKEKYPDIKLRVANALKVKTPKGISAWIRQGEYHRYLNKLIRDLGVENNIDLLPSLTAEEVAEELKRAELFCLPSLCENSPNSLGEAMLMGCPAIATDVGGTETIMKKGEQGALVPSGDPAILAYWIDKLFTDKDLAERYAAAAQEDARQRYDPKVVVGQLMEAYRQVIAKRN